MPAASEGPGPTGLPAVTSSPEATQTPAEPAGPGLFGRLLRAGATSIMATVISHGVYVGLLALARADATLASTVAFFCGAVFNYVVGRRFTWGRRDRPHPLKEMLPYVVVIAAGGAVSIAVATLVQHLVRPMGMSLTERTVVLELANVVSYGVVFFFKFTLLDRLVFRRD
jgi:putative flippase GtrA